MESKERRMVGESNMTVRWKERKHRGGRGGVREVFQEKWKEEVRGGKVRKGL